MSVRLFEIFLSPKSLTFHPFCLHGATHGLAMVLKIRSGSGITDWVMYQSKIVPFFKGLRSDVSLSR